jgi:hypothetical protein
MIEQAAYSLGLIVKPAQCPTDDTLIRAVRAGIEFAPPS